MIRAGRLKHRVLLQKPVEVQNSDTGAITTTWEDVATVWAAIEPISVRELLSAQITNSKINVKVTTRYRNDIDYSYRIYHAYKNLYYNIEGILPDKESGLEYLTILVSTGVRI